MSEEEVKEAEKCENDVNEYLTYDDETNCSPAFKDFLISNLKNNKNAINETKERIKSPHKKLSKLNVSSFNDVKSAGSYSNILF